MERRILRFLTVARQQQVVLVHLVAIINFQVVVIVLGHQRTAHLHLVARHGGIDSQDVVSVGTVVAVNAAIVQNDS